MSPNSFTATIQEAAQLEEKGIDLDAGKLSDLRFADNVALTGKSIKDMEHQFNTVDKESVKAGLKI